MSLNEWIKKTLLIESIYSISLPSSALQKLMSMNLHSESKERMKRVLQEEISSMKHERDRITLENARLDNTVERLVSEKETISSKLRESQNIIASLRQQVSVIAAKTY